MMCPHAELVLGRAVELDTERQRVRVEVGEDVFGIHYTDLVIALGSVSRTLPIPGLAERALGLSSAT